MPAGDLALFALQSTRAYGEGVARRLGVPLAAHEERGFEDGEHKARSLVNVRGSDAFVVQSLHADARESVHDKLCRLLFFLGALKDSAAGRVTAVVPYLCYGRKDRKTKSRDPVTTRYVAMLFEAVGADRVAAIDVHNLIAFQNAFRCPTEHLEARKLFAAHFAPLLAGEEAVVVSPDVGGVKRAERFRDALAAALGRPVPVAFMEKQRSAGVVSGEAVVGEVGGRAAIVIDDLISTGTTMLRAARALKERGATRVFAAATHGLFIGEAGRVLADPAFERVVVTDTVPPFRLDPALVRERLTILDTTGLVAESIRRMHAGGSLVELLE
ncbi:MAG: ribose-phosphate pyrophosphokinase [Proteobacteria bacterium]|nr:ribose-phosphate pyrophosphokinase [Pseudomonadota bacterium]